MEHSDYRFILCDFSLPDAAPPDADGQWQRLGTQHGYSVPQPIETTGRAASWRAMEDGGALWTSTQWGQIARYGAAGVPHQVRDAAQRAEAFLLELRTSRRARGYRRVCQEIHRLITTRPGIRSSEAMKFVDDRLRPRAAGRRTQIGAEAR